MDINSGVLALIIVIIYSLGNLLAGINKVRNEYGSLKNWLVNKEMIKQEQLKEANKLKNGFDELNEKINDISKTQEVQQTINIMLLREKLKDQLEKALDRGFVFYDEMDSINEMANIYNAVSTQNGIHSRYERVRKLPTKRRYEDD
ncbi:hypothetical protein [Fastidiosipila sanguinis]|uniref:Uncharacterized protein n=1 Tax=Fastidiosipila sanguinis TaxID=236753 RepID=A0A2S0KP65_9FIRM|nr:hypothetical protein [Fastidiosipila sanguinis]AVM42813.1 hypothetical protein C5Q98_06130 [Fastidiosipila sanguinis]